MRAWVLLSLVLSMPAFAGEKVRFILQWEMPNETTENAADYWEIKVSINRGERKKRYRFDGLLLREIDWSIRHMMSRDRVAVRFRGCNERGCGPWADKIIARMPKRLARPTKPIKL